MSRYTKRELEEQLDILRHENRRYRRALNMVNIDIDVQKNVNVNVNIDRKVPPNEHVQTVLKNCESEWNRNVTEPGEGGDSSRISYYINSKNCLGWSNVEYEKNGDFAWCGAFAAAVYGVQVLYNIRYKIFSSCYRFYDNWKNTSRYQQKENILPGDIVIVFTSDDRKPFWGNHITIARTSPDQNGDFHTTEGNAHGVNPEQKWVEGVVKRTRNIENVAHVYRLIDEDYEQ